MKNTSIAACLAAGLLVLSAGVYLCDQCGIGAADANLQPEKNDADRVRFVRVAFEGASKVMAIPDLSSAKVELHEKTVFVTFPFNPKKQDGRPPPPGPDYLARVKIDRHTGEILEILVAQ